MFQTETLARSAQERGELARGSVRTDIVLHGNHVRPATSREIGVSRLEIHEARQLRDAEAADPGVVRVRIRSRAFRRMGEILKQIEPGKTGPKSELKADGGLQLTRRSAAEEAGISERQQKTAIRVASIPADEFEKKIESDFPPTVTALMVEGPQHQAEARSQPAVAATSARIGSHTTWAGSMSGRRRRTAAQGAGLTFQ